MLPATVLKQPLPQSEEMLQALLPQFPRRDILFLQISQGDMLAQEEALSSPCPPLPILQSTQNRDDIVAHAFFHELPVSHHQYPASLFPCLALQQKALYYKRHHPLHSFLPLHSSL